MPKRLALFLVLCWTGCLTETDKDREPAPAVLVPSRVRSVPQGSSDTAVTLLRYDLHGRLIREIRDASVREWDSLGRYVGVRPVDSAGYLERVAWIGPDSTVRTQAGGLVLHDRFFNRRPNCWCADSIRHSIGDPYVATRKFTFDTAGNPVSVTLTWQSDSRVDLVQYYWNTYDSTGKLVRVVLQDGETGAVTTTLRLIDYDTLKNVVESR